MAMWFISLALPSMVLALNTAHVDAGLALRECLYIPCQRDNKTSTFINLSEVVT